MEHLIYILHSISLGVAIGSAVLLGLYLALNLRLPRLGLWPSASGWRHHTAFGLFRLFCGATVVFALSEVWVNGWGHWVRYVIGVPIMVLSFGITLWGYRFLGLDNTYCESDGLVTGGMYAYSRNPQYVTSVLATIGLGIASGSWVTLALAAALFFIYFLFVLNEERWLLQGYGRAFQEYMRSTPRFVDERSLMRVRDAILN
ncbi:PEMT/PEM2 methyltransferase family protein [Ruegeria sp. R14_0]|uniref:methyltransferase family protein n=1 Tax=Ruegeria sp. R14_0 TaxID=2821100 RepID=UPI001AD9562E|nr:PEMT/PEM2 methyltransferase family protein [Ruegeria sp. R14_0]MBO9446499.1 phosphatidylethanolamine N-methyltransferase family protein [Ruegeria sp. R14_0]